MIKLLIRRLALGVTALAVLATSAGVAVVALAFTLYALVRPYVGPAGAGALVCGAAFLILLIAAVALAMAAKPRRPTLAKSEAGDPGRRILTLMRDKPITTIAAALGVGLMAVRNPGYIGAALRSFLEGEPPRKRGRR